MVNLTKLEKEYLEISKIMSKTLQVVESSYPDWNPIYNKAAQAVVFSNFAYKKNDEDMEKVANQVPDGYELFLMTDHADKHELGKASFRCVAFINETSKEIVFATSGTRPGANQVGIDDLMDDVRLITHNKPKKMNSAQALNSMILDSLGEAAKDYKFHYTGHSLGAAMAEMQAADMDIRLTQKNLKSEQQISAITFENPGTKPIIEKMYKKADLPVENASNLQFHAFNNRKNIINSLNTQTGEIYTIVPNSQKERNPTASQMAFGVLSKKAGKALSPLVGKAFGLLAPGGVTDDLRSEHSLANFSEVLVQKTGEVHSEPKAISSFEAVYDKITANVTKPESVKAKMQRKLDSNSKKVYEEVKSMYKKVIHELHQKSPEKPSAAKQERMKKQKPSIKR